MRLVSQSKSGISHVDGSMEIYGGRVHRAKLSTPTGRAGACSTHHKIIWRGQSLAVRRERRARCCGPFDQRRVVRFMAIFNMAALRASRRETSSPQRLVMTAAHVFTATEMTMVWRNRWLVPLVVLATAVGLGSCRSTDPQPRPSTTVAVAPRTPSPTPTDQTAAATHAAAEAYAGMWQAYARAGRTTEPQYAELARYADGDALAALRAGLDGNRRQGLVTKGDLVPHPSVTALTPTNKPDTASIRDCLDTSRATRVKASPGGSPFSDTPGGRRLVTATVKNLDGIWKVVSFVPLDVGTC